jgi:hypothetical protein
LWRSVRIRALCGPAALIDGDGEAQPAREGEIGRMLGAEDAADAVRLEHKLDDRGDGVGC